MLPQHSGPRAVKSKDSSPSFRWLLMNSLGNVFRRGYHLATATLALATGSTEGPGRRGAILVPEACGPS